MIDFRRKIHALRPYKTRSKNNEADTHIDILRLQRQLESDRGRIMTSAAIRRLQQKTQVFPLERNAAVRSRLTHSLEVMQNGRYIAKTLFEKLETNNMDFGLRNMGAAVESIVEMACLMHDIGNPPFGHFGEGAIMNWFSRHTLSLFHQHFRQLSDHQTALMTDMVRDIENFEGNAQAIRLTYSLQKMNLTYVQSACILKYTRPAWVPKPSGSSVDYLHKKPGYYLSERQFVNALWEALDMQPDKRHPLTYIMEAADDIAYCLADIEDAVDKEILSIERVVFLLKETYSQSGNDPEQEHFKDIWQNGKSFNALVEYAFQRSEDEPINKAHEFFVWLRVGLIHNLVNHVAERFIDNIEAVYHGEFDAALLEDNSPAHSVVETFKYVGRNYVFNHSEVQTLEIKGYQMMTGLLDQYQCLLLMSYDDFQSILLPGGKTSFLLESRLLNRLGNKYIKAYQEAVNRYALSDGDDQYLWELYFRHRLIQDHISGMNDQYVEDEFSLLKVV